MAFRRRYRAWLVAGAFFGLIVGCSADTPGAPDGRRVPIVGGGAGRAGMSSQSASSAGQGGSGFANPTQSSVAGASSAGRSAPVDMGCPDGTANAMPVTPTIWFIVDGSSSMNAAFDAGATRWQALRSTLMDPGAVMQSLAPVARIGMVIYSGGGLGAECTNLITVEPALDNYATLDAMYPQDPIGMGTPTDRALDHVVTNLPVSNMDMLDTDVDPIYVVLATDGQPNDSCSGGFGDDAAVRQRVIDVTTRGTSMGMDMFIISLAAGEADLQSHLEQVAMATRSKTPPFVPSTKAELIKTFLDIVGEPACQVGLDGMVKTGEQCKGEVALNGKPLACDSDNGWRLLDPSTVQLTGTACEDFRKMKAQVHASFPCGVFVQ